MFWNKNLMLKNKEKKKILLACVVVFAFCPIAKASDIAFYVGAYSPSWYGDEQFEHVETIIAETGHLFKDIQQFDDTQFDEFSAWVDERTNDGTMDIIWLNGCLPSVLYPPSNLEPDGSRIEEWLDGGNMIINIGDWFAYVSYENGTRQPYNFAMGVANILDLSVDGVNNNYGVIVIADNTQMTVTPTGKEYLPSLNDPAKTDRPIILSFLEAPWEVAAIFASPGGTDDPALEEQADPVVIYNTETDGYVAFINQAYGGPDGWINDRGLTCAEFIANWVHSVIGLGDQPLTRRPTPRDGIVHNGTWINLSWFSGDFAASHDVYLSDNFDDVNDGNESAFQGNQVETFTVAGFPGFPCPEGLIPDTTYYWRIDEVNETEPNSPWKGNVWSFSVAPKTAYEPNPPDAAELVDPSVNLSWKAGLGALVHTVYFGDSFEAVDNAAGEGPQTDTTYDPGPLELGKTYYWRADESDGVETYKGYVWSFTISI